jgi:tetratricopeptide (TPR) repeat protein
MLFSRSLRAFLAVGATVAAMGGQSALAEEYTVLEAVNGVDVRSPSGDHFFLGDAHTVNSPQYRLEVPLKDLQKTRQPTAILAVPPPPAAPAQKPEPPPKPVVKEEPAPKYGTDDSDVLGFLLEANRLFNRGKYYESMSFVDEVIRRRPANVRAWVMKGSLLFLLGQKDLARQSWEKATALAPQDKQVKDALEKYQ